jgi:hypothetical protein
LEREGRKVYNDEVGEKDHLIETDYYFTPHYLLQRKKLGICENCTRFIHSAFTNNKAPFENRSIFLVARIKLVDQES